MKKGDPVGYDVLAQEYYDDSHRTSRNFDETTASYFRESPVKPPSHGGILEAGSGRGRANEFLGWPSSRVIHLDSSRRMLRLDDRAECRARVQGDARQLPFADRFIDASCAFLYDAFNTPAFYDELSRVLKPGGIFVGTLPHPVWGEALRESMGICIDRAVFQVNDGSEVSVPSHLLYEPKLRSWMASCGFKAERIESVTLPKTVDRVSSDILISAEEVDVDPYNLPILQVIVAVYRGE